MINDAFTTAFFGRGRYNVYLPFPYHFSRLGCAALTHSLDSRRCRSSMATVEATDIAPTRSAARYDRNRTREHPLIIACVGRWLYRRRPINSGNITLTSGTGPIRSGKKLRLGLPTQWQYRGAAGFTQRYKKHAGGGWGQGLWYWHQRSKTQARCQQDTYVRERRCNRNQQEHAGWLYRFTAPDTSERCGRY